MAFDPERFVDAVLTRLRPDRLLDRPEVGVAIDSLGPRVALACLGKPSAAYSNALKARLGDRISHSMLVGLHTGHPVPDDASLAAGEQLLEFAQAIPDDTDFLFFVAGGGSALAVAPRPPFDLSDVQAMTERALAAGASIADLNRLRSSMSRLKNGGLLVDCHARRVLTLVLADVPSGDPGLVASGPTIYSGHAARVAERFPLPKLREHLASEEFAAWQDRLLAAQRGDVVRVAGYPELANAARTVLREQGFGDVRVFESALDEPIEAGVERHLAALGELGANSALVSGGELPTRIRGAGRGGRNTEFVVRLAARLVDVPGSWQVLSFATDGSDGRSWSAGGWIDPALMRGVDIQPMLETSDTAYLLAQRGGLFSARDTATNLMDLHVIVRHL
ncbi:MAG: DUF4147 domain-containing protein [Planctomycetota bacterium]